MNFKKRVNGSWVDIPHYIHNTSTDTLTTLPSDIYANDTTATVGLKGDMSQSGSPTPTAPIQPSECGDRTGNLFDKDSATENYYVESSSGNLVYGTRYFASDYIAVSQGNQYRWNDATRGNAGAFYDSNKQYISGWSSAETRYIFTVPNGASYVRLTGEKADLATYILVEGTSPPSTYIPYGYKIPILSANTTTPVYLGEVQSTRRIKKLVLDGTENFTKNGYNLMLRQNDLMSFSPAIYIYSTHYANSQTSKYVRQYTSTYWSETPIPVIGIYDEDYSSANDFKAYLAQQYAAGTPVTVWYVLATETTGIVNEPLRKIGEYADTVSGITIPTIAGANTISVDTTLQPSEVTVNYKGWHPVQSVHEYDSNYTIATMQALTIAQLQTHTISD
ncbi:MAG: hypothetical protein J6Y64_00445 [Ruminococcus sp.]|nr:hypothetical protein [Ruminococcus sp.]